MNLLGYDFRRLDSQLALSILKPDMKSHAQAEELKTNFNELQSDYLKKYEISLFDMK